VTSLALALALAASDPQPPPPPAWWGGRVLTTADVHLGVRPAAYLDAVDGHVGEAAIGCTVRLALRTPW